MLLTLPSLIIALLLSTFAFLFYFLFLKPWLGIRFYRKQGCKMTFFPLLGNIKTSIDCLAKKGDFYGHWKQQTKDNPEVHAFGGNFLDKPQLCIVNPVLIKEFFIRQDNYIKAPMLADMFRLIAGEGLTVVEGAVWKRHRRIIASAFHYELLRDMVPDIVKISSQVLDDLKKEDLNNVHMAGVFEGLAGEIVGRLFFGENFSDYRIKGKHVIAFLTDLDVRLGSQMPTLMYTLFGTKAIKMGVLPIYRTIMEDSREFNKWASAVVEKKVIAAKAADQQGEKTRNTLIDTLIRQSKHESEEPFSNEEIISEFINFIGAGKDTTGNLLHMTVYYLSQYPQYKEKLREEINRYFEDPSQVTLDSLNQMELTTAFIKETLRLAPPLPGIVERVAVQDHKLGHINIKKGTFVNIGIVSNNYNPAYHNDEDTFMPERWVTDSKTKDSVVKNPFVFVPFASGARNCVGQHLAMNEAKIVLSLFLKKYDFSLSPDYKLKMTQRLFYVPLEPMSFKLVPR